MLKNFKAEKKDWTFFIDQHFKLPNRQIYCHHALSFLYEQLIGQGQNNSESTDDGKNKEFILSYGVELEKTFF